MPNRSLTALPVFNEAQYVNSVLDQVKLYSEEVLVVDDGSTDGTGALLRARQDIEVVKHPKNRGYGAALRTAFQYAVDHAYQTIVTIDCDGQHEPQRIPQFVEACQSADIVSGSRYCELFVDDALPPADRRRINQEITAELNRRLGLKLTDAFCGFKAYRVAELRKLSLSEDGYAMPLELWIKAAAAGFRIVELAVPLIYLDQDRSFGGALDDPHTRLAYYHEVMNRAQLAVDQARCEPIAALCGDLSG